MATSPFRRRKGGKTGKLLLIGAVAVAGAAALLKRDKVAGLLPSRTDEPAPAPPAPPQQSNYDAPGPVANTATPVPAPDPQEAPPAAIDEAAEEAAAAAEAAAIGGTTSDYAGSELGETAGEAEVPLAESGQGESEGQEQAEAALADNATYRDAGMSDAERQIEDTIEQAGQPSAGETPDPLAEPGGGISGRPYSGLDEGDVEEEPAATEEPAASEDAGGDDSSGGDDDWRTWSGRSVNP
jgi:hypothetical protein